MQPALLDQNSLCACVFHQPMQLHACTGQVCEPQLGLVAGYETTVLCSQVIVFVSGVEKKIW